MILKKIKEKNCKGFYAIAKCDWCKREFRRSYYSVAKYKNHFCNRECMSKWKIGENNPRYGKHHSEETISKISRAKIGKHVGENNPNWRGGKHINCEGYILIHKPDHPHATKTKCVMEHRLIMEKHLGRYLMEEEVIHHINGDKADNKVENLAIFANSVEHLKYHRMNKEDL